MHASICIQSRPWIKRSIERSYYTQEARHEIVYTFLFSQTARRPNILILILILNWFTKYYQKDIYACIIYSIYIYAWFTYTVYIYACMGNAMHAIFFIYAILCMVSCSAPWGLCYIGFWRSPSEFSRQFKSSYFTLVFITVEIYA